MLHIVKQISDISNATEYSLAEDQILLTEDSVYAGLVGHSAYNELRNCGRNIYLLEADLKARGLIELVNQTLKVIDYSEMVELTESEPKSISW